MDIFAITSKHSCWSDTIQFVDNSCWQGGRYLAGIMKRNQFRDWERVFIAQNEKNIVGYCTFTERDELSEEYDFSPFIGCIFVDEKYRGNRHSEMLIKKVLEYARELGFESVYIMSNEIGLYEKYGQMLLPCKV